MRAVATVVMAAGALVLAAALLADRVGIGASGGDFGWKQMVGTMLGAGLLFGGARARWGGTHRRAEAGAGEGEG